MSEPVGVLHVIQSFSMGGAERMAVELVNRTCRREFRPALLSTRGDGPLRAEVSADVPVLTLDRRQRWDVRSFAAFRHFIHKHRIRIVHSHGPGPLQYVTAGLLPGRRRCVHLFHDHHGRENARLPEPDLALRLSFRLGLSAVVGVSRIACEWASLRMGWPSEKTFLLRNGIATERFSQLKPAAIRQELGIPEGALLLGMVANLRAPKDHLTGLQALARSRNRNRVHVLCLGGAAPGEQEYEQQVRGAAVELGLHTRVHFLGLRRDVPEILAACDGGLLSSSFESGPLALLEYLAAGIPFASTRVGEISEGLADRGVGFMAPPRDPEALARALDALVGLCPQERCRMGEKGREIVFREYDQRHTARRLAKIHQQVLRW